MNVLIFGASGTMGSGPVTPRRRSRKSPVHLSAQAAIGAVVLAFFATPARAQNPDRVFLEDYTWPELQATIAHGTVNVLVFAGGVEESGPHLVLGKHNIRARAYAARIAQDVGRTLVAPIVPAAPAGPTLRRFPGSLDIRAGVFAAYVGDMVRSLAAAGFTHVFLLGDHGGTQAPLKEVARQLDRALAPHGTRVYFVGDGYAKASAQIETLAAQRGLRASGHGGLWDTAELWAIAPAAVRPQLLAPGDTSRSGALDQRGVSGDPRGATPELGREFAAIRVRDAVAQIRSLLAGHAP